MQVIYYNNYTEKINNYKRTNKENGFYKKEIK